MHAPRKNYRPRRPLVVDSERADTPSRWVIIFILLSLLIHVLMMVGIIYITLHSPKFAAPTAQNQPPPQVSLTLQPSPPAARQRFITTDPQANVPPQQSPLISDNDTLLHSRNQVSRAPDQPLPDVTGRKERAEELHTRPPAPQTQKPQPSQPTPPQPQQTAQQQTQKQQQQKQPPQKPTQTAQTAQPTQAQKQNPQPQPNPDPNAISQKILSKELKPPTPSQDPNALPLLPAINAPTLAQQNPQLAQNAATASRPTSHPVPSFAVYQSDVTGQAGTPGENSASAMATDLGRYKAKVYRAVGARWYEKVQKQLQVLGVGSVHITYTIHSDGRLEIVADPDSGTAALMLLHSVSLNSMTEAAPFDPFSPSMLKDVGESFTDDFTFSIYGD